MSLVINRTRDVATQGVFDDPIGFATLGWLIRTDVVVVPPEPPIVLPPPEFPDTICILADPLSTATEGILDQPTGISTLGWVVCIPTDAEISIPELISEQERDWWYRKDDTDPWFGPLSYQTANSQARRMTLDVDETINEVKYAQLGTVFGTRGGDPQVDPNMMVVFLYANGRQYLGGRMATYNADKVPVS
jgi:hypothetical protein